MIGRPELYLLARVNRAIGRLERSALRGELDAIEDLLVAYTAYLLADQESEEPEADAFDASILPTGLMNLIDDGITAPEGGRIDGED